MPYYSRNRPLPSLDTKIKKGDDLKLQLEEYRNEMKSFLVYQREYSITVTPSPKNEGWWIKALKELSKELRPLGWVTMIVNGTTTFRPGGRRKIVAMAIRDPKKEESFYERDSRDMKVVLKPNKPSTPRKKKD